MNKLARIFGIGAGGLLLFASAFILFTALSGVPLRDVAVLGSIIDGDTKPEDAAEAVSAAEAEPYKTDGEIIEANVDVLDAFLIESPFDAQGLESLQRELKGKIRELEDRRRRQRERERELDEREESLGTRYDELMKLRSTLEELEAELYARSEEIDRDERAQKQRERDAWKRLARSFEDGDVEELAERLALYPPADAAKLLHALDDERAGELLNELPVDVYKDYAEAYLEFREEP
jgi:flagellar motility protein MotE (MotC chaperone)